MPERPTNLDNSRAIIQYTLSGPLKIFNHPQLQLLHIAMLPKAGINQMMQC